MTSTSSTISTLLFDFTLVIYSTSGNPCYPEKIIPHIESSLVIIAIAYINGMKFLPTLSTHKSTGESLIS